MDHETPQLTDSNPVLPCIYMSFMQSPIYGALLQPGTQQFPAFMGSAITVSSCSYKAVLQMTTAGQTSIALLQSNSRTDSSRRAGY